MTITKEEGYTLLELLIVMGLMSAFMVFIMHSFLSLYQSYTRADQKAQNLEEARLIINHLTDKFYSCDDYQVVLAGGSQPRDLDADGFAPLKEVVFYEIRQDPYEANKTSTKSCKISYQQKQAANPAKGIPAIGQINWCNITSVEVASQVSAFKAKVDPLNDLIEFKIEVLKQGHGLVADQKLEVATSLNLKYMPRHIEEKVGD